MLFATGGCIRVRPSNGPGGSMSLISVGTNARVSGISGATSTSFTKSVKWLVRLTISCRTVSMPTRSRRIHWWTVSS